MKNLLILCAGNHIINNMPIFLLRHFDGRLIAAKLIEGINIKQYDRIFYVILKSVEKQYDVIERIRESVIDKFTPEFILLSDITSGPAETVYNAVKEADITGEVVIRDSHVYIEVNGNYGGNFVAGLNLMSYGKTVDNLRRKSFIVSNEQNQILDIVEKRLCSDTIACGLYGFKNINDFTKTYEKIINTNYPIKKLYISHIISYLIGYKQMVFQMIDVHMFEDWLANESYLKIDNKYAGDIKLIMVDLDGTLCNTKEVNYRSYAEALTEFGYNIDYNYYCDYCNGKHYLDFLPSITTNNKEILSIIHDRKKQFYCKNLKYAALNTNLVNLLQILKKHSKIALVTTASKENTYQLLNKFEIIDIFDLIITHDNVSKSKPDPEGYLKAINYFGFPKNECIIFEDSEVGVEAAYRSGVQCFVVKGFN